MKITRISAWSGKQHTLEIPITDAQLHAWRNGTLIQVAMPQLAAWEREFLISGMTQEEWTEMCDEVTEDEEEDAQ